jgi:hypothetical protein
MFNAENLPTPNPSPRHNHSRRSQNADSSFCPRVPREVGQVASEQTPHPQPLPSTQSFEERGAIR